jgi:predicted LPLAT superfamily acyltransferase
LANQEQVETYLERVRQRQEEAWQEQQRHPSEFVRSLRERIEQQRQALRQGKPQPAPTVK